MTFELNISQSSLDAVTRNTQLTLNAIKSHLQSVMAQKFQWCVWQNFGGAEKFTREPFAPLSPKYAQRVGRDFATLYVTGKLKEAVQIVDAGDETMVRVDSAEVPYAMAHQYGSKKNNLPARPYFPMDDDGTVLPEVAELVTNAAREELQRMLS